MMNDTPLALIIDDESDIRELLEITLIRMGITSKSAENLEEAKSFLSENIFDICLTDMRLPDGDGLELVEFIQKSYPKTPVAVITAHGNMETAVQALKLGAFDFLSKPVDLDILRQLVSSALKLPSPDSGTNNEIEIIGSSKEIEELRNKIIKVSRSQAPIYIYGESGTGKELVARSIHQKSSRNDKPFVPINCGAIPAELMESELFGHEKGSFTGADSRKEGLFHVAEGGTLFLDEVADLPLHLQVKLLRVIQEKKIRPIGSNEEIPIDVRIISASHKNLYELMEKEQFRNDLYYRINVIQLDIPSLRDRKSDIKELANFLLQTRISSDTERKPSLSDEAIRVLEDYQFPGNVRELENILERAVAYSEGNIIGNAHIDISGITLQEKTESVNTTPDSIPDGFKLESYLDNIEKDMILKACEETRWKKTEAAKLLGISFRSLRYKLKKLGLEEE